MSRSMVRQLHNLYRRSVVLSSLKQTIQCSTANIQTARHGSRHFSSVPRNRAARAVRIEVGGKPHDFSPILLRDLCRCEKCVDPSTKQKLFSTVDIPENISATNVSVDGSSVRLSWQNDLKDLSSDHTTSLSSEVLASLVRDGNPRTEQQLPRRVLWDADTFSSDVKDMDYEAYMQDDFTLHQALQTLHTHGLLFLTKVPESETSVSTIAERIGPIKNTFYGYTWDVRSVPQAKNVAYTSQDLGFHMDLLYMYQPPHLQFLHCIRSSSAGGASLFSDSFKAASDLRAIDEQAFNNLAEQTVHFHYDHPESQYYRQVRHVVELVKERRHPARELAGKHTQNHDVADTVDAISWSPPFQAPFSIPSSTELERNTLQELSKSEAVHPEAWLSSETQRWHSAAKKFNSLIHKPENILERLMKPGECVLFDNRRVLHARRAFEVSDLGKERWLRGTYLDKDPYNSKLSLLQSRYGPL